jgi:hypothetical protein
VVGGPAGQPTACADPKIDAFWEVGVPAGTADVTSRVEASPRSSLHNRACFSVEPRHSFPGTTACGPPAAVLDTSENTDVAGLRTLGSLSDLRLHPLVLLSVDRD